MEETNHEDFLIEELIKMDPMVEDVNALITAMRDMNSIDESAGPDYRMMLEYAIFRASFYLSAGKFHSCMEQLRNVMNRPSQAHFNFNLGNFSVVLSSIADVMGGRSKVVKEDDLDVFTKCIDVVELILSPHRGHVPHNLLLHFTYLQKSLVKYLPLFIQLRSSMTEEDINNFHQRLFTFVDLNLRDDYGRQLVHLVCRYSDPSFPLYEVVELLLLKAGANPQAVDCRGQTPLHNVAMKQHPSRPRVLKLLVSKCCCCGLNATNAQNKLFTDYIPIEMASDDLSLFCLSAKAVAKYAIPHRSVLPAKITAFVKMHLLCMCTVVYRDPRDFDAINRHLMS